MTLCGENYKNLHHNISTTWKQSGGLNKRDGTEKKDKLLHPASSHPNTSSFTRCLKQLLVSEAFLCGKVSIRRAGTMAKMNDRNLMSYWLHLSPSEQENPNILTPSQLLETYTSNSSLCRWIPTLKDWFEMPNSCTTRRFGLKSATRFFTWDHREY